jgi:hypothetical protein
MQLKILRFILPLLLLASTANAQWTNGRSHAAGGATNWCTGSSAAVAYGSLPVSPTIYCEQWATGIASSCRAHFPPSYLYGGAQQTVSQVTISAAFAPLTTGTPNIVAVTQAIGSNISVPSHSDGPGNLLVWFETNYNAYPTTPSGWVAAGQATNSPTSPQFLSMFTRVPSSEPANYPLTGASFYSSIMYSLSNVANSTTPDAVATRSDGTQETGLTAPALTGLSTSTDLALYGFTWGSTVSYPSISTISAQGAITNTVDANIPFANGGPNASQGILTAHLGLSGTSEGTQTATTPVAGSQTCKVFYDGTEYIEEGF